MNEDPAEEVLYPQGTLPDTNYRGFVYDFGLNRSPNGSIEYRGAAFDGALDGTLMVVEWSGGDRVLGLSVNNSGQVTADFVVADGLSNPIDLAVHESTGTIFVSEMSREDLFDGDLTRLSPVE